MTETRCCCAHLTPLKSGQNDRSLHGSVLAVAHAGNPTTVACGHYIGLRWALYRGGVGPLFCEGTNSKWEGGLTPSVRKLDARFHPNRRASTDQAPGPRRARAAPRVPKKTQVQRSAVCTNALHDARIAKRLPAI